MRSEKVRNAPCLLSLALAVIAGCPNHRDVPVGKEIPRCADGQSAVVKRITRFQLARENAARDVVFAGGPDHVAVAGARGIEVWDVSAPKISKQIDLPGKASLVKLAWLSAPGNLIATDDDGRLWVLSAENARWRMHRNGHESLVHELRMSRSGKYCLTGSFDGSAEVWKLPALDCVASLGGIPDNRPTGVAVADDGTIVAIARGDGLEIRNVEKKLVMYKVNIEPASTIMGIDFAPNKGALVAGNAAGVWLVDVASGNRARIWQSPEGGCLVTDVRYIGEAGHYVAAIVFPNPKRWQEGGRLVVIETKSKQAVEFNVELPNGLAVSPNGKRIAVLEGMDKVSVYSFEGR